MSHRSGRLKRASLDKGPGVENLDVRDVKEGTKCYLNCYHDGALLYVGDVHGSQGDTEFYGVADETRAELTLSCRVIKNKRIPFVRLEKADSIISVYSFRAAGERRRVRDSEPDGVDSPQNMGVSERDCLYATRALTPNFE